MAELLLVELVLFQWSKVPFACANIPGPEGLKSRWPLFLICLNLYAYQLDDLQLLALRSTVGTLAYVAIVGGAAVLARFFRRRRERAVAIEFDVSSEGGLQTLGLSEASR